MPSNRIRHEPQESVLYRVVRGHLDTFLRTAREHGALPAFIEKTFRAFLKCGLPEHGFIRVHCPACGRDDIVCFSCKCRGPCPSCSARAMGDGAVHLCDHVLPRVAYRQWVVSYPFEMNGRLAFQPDLLAAVERIVTDALCRWQKARAGDDGGKPGGVLVRHRFGGSLNLHIHAHLLVMDGVYRKNADGGLAFHRTPAPGVQELDGLAADIRRRMATLFKRRGLVRDDDTGNLPEQLDALGACGRLALGKGRRERSGPALSVVDEDDVEHPRGGVVGKAGGLNVYASNAIDGEDRATLEKLCRYVLRGPIALSRLRERPNGLLEYRLKKADRRGKTVLVMTPVELMMRLASLIPAPRYPTRKYFGILAAGARDRKAVVPSPTTRKNKHCGNRPKPPVQSPVKWADLLKRVWNIDALDCPKCHARMTAMAIIEDPDEVARYLAHTGQATVHPRTTGPPEAAA